MTATSLVSDSFNCMFEVMGKYENGSDDFNVMYNKFGMLYGQKNTGAWVTVSDVAEMEQFCRDNGAAVGGINYCLSTIAVISSANVGYCNEDCKEAVDGMWFFYTLRNSQPFSVCSVVFN